MIEARNLTKKYKDQYVLKEVSFQVGKGELFCLVGANGAGKSTTLKLFTQQIQPTSGEALIHDINVADNYKAVKPLVTYIPENLALYGLLTGYENLRFFCEIAGIKYSRYKLESYLVKAGLEPQHFSKRMSEYSKGMRQKIGIAFALAKKSEVLFLDEPTSGLDPKSIAEFSNLIQTLKVDGMSILMTSHDLFRTINDADKIGIMKAGKLLETIDAVSTTHSLLENKYMSHMNA